MKIASSLTIALVLLLSSTSALLGGDKTAEKPKDPKPAKVEKTKKAAKAARRGEQVAMTGSYIKREIRQNGVVTDGPDPVFVLDERAIRNSGAADLRELLVLRGLNR